ncbi:hypothetical protein TNCV_3523401 [Trichonephila clavipes]|nr:hypothetical protein TNCV_3523401 [Trichonephila clavipes]
MIEINRTIGDKTMIPQIDQLIKKYNEEKEFKVSELRNIPPCLDTNCPDHTILKPPVLEPQLSNTKKPVINLTKEKDSTKTRAPNPITLKVSKNYREQIKMINETFPDIQIKSAGEYFKLFPNNDDESRSLTHFLESDKQYQFYSIPPKENKPH